MSYARHIRSCNQWNPAGFIPFAVSDTQYGWMRPAFARELRRFPSTFTVDDDYVALHPALRTFKARNSAVAEALDELVSESVLDHVMGELYPVVHEWGERPAFLLDRAAVSAFGTRSFGQHLNGIVPTEFGVSMWIGRRAIDRHSFPDQLDQMVAGGLPFDFSPQCTDGEVSEFFLWPLEEVARVVREADEFKPNCNLVVIDFLLRHGLIASDHPEFNELESSLRVL